MLTERFGAEVVTERKAAITGSGLTIGMLDNPGLQLEVGTEATTVSPPVPLTLHRMVSNQRPVQ